MRWRKALGAAPPRGGRFGFRPGNAGQPLLAPDHRAAVDRRAEPCKPKQVLVGWRLREVPGRSICHSTRLRTGPTTDSNARRSRTRAFLSGAGDCDLRTAATVVCGPVSTRGTTRSCFMHVLQAFAGASSLGATASPGSHSATQVGLPGCDGDTARTVPGTEPATWSTQRLVTPTSPAALSSSGMSVPLLPVILKYGRQQLHLAVHQPLRPLVSRPLDHVRGMLPAGVRLSACLAHDALHGEVDGNPLQQVLTDHCTNAWHASSSDSGSIEVGLDALTAGISGTPRAEPLAPGRRAHLWVNDRGSFRDEATGSASSNLTSPPNGGPRHRPRRGGGARHRDRAPRSDSGRPSRASGLDDPHRPARHRGRAGTCPAAARAGGSSATNRRGGPEHPCWSTTTP